MTAEGTRVAGRYVIRRRLGQGGMGVVWLADDEKLGRSVALKVLPPHRVGDDGARSRLIREARSAAALEHPGMVRVYDVGETDDGGAFLVMEHVRGKNVRDLLGDPGFTQSARLASLASLARSLAAAHRAGFVHRDVKPENVMRTDDGRMVLLDLGLAKSILPASEPGAAIADTAHATAEGMLMGTPAYLAPEQARGATLDGRADQFALGVMIHEVMTGRLPWSATNIPGLLVEIVSDTPPPPSSVDPTLPPELDAIVARALEKKADARFADMDELAGALEELVPPGGSGPRAAISAPRISSGQGATPAATSTPVPPTVSGRGLGGGPAATPAATPAGTLDPLSVPRRPPTSRRAGAAIGIALLAATGIGAWLAMAPRPSPLVDAHAIIACPQLEASGVDAPAGWLGAAAAAIACDQAWAWRGGDDAGTLAPAQLLDLPRTPTDGADRDVYGAEGARERAIASARARGAAFLDGRVVRAERSFEVELVLRDREGVELGRATARGAVLPRAVHDAVAALAADGSLHPAEQLSERAADRAGTSDPATAALLASTMIAGNAGSAIGALECPALADRDLAPDVRVMVDRACARARSEEPGPLPPLSVDARRPELLARTAAALTAFGVEGIDLHALARDLAEAREREREPGTIASLSYAEFVVRETLGERAPELALAAIENMPTHAGAWSAFNGSAYGTRDAAPSAISYSRWVAYEPDSWNCIGHTLRTGVSVEPALHYYERGVAIGGDLPLWSTNLAAVSLALGDRQRPHALAARLATGGLCQQIGSAQISASVDVAEARFAAAIGRWTRLLDRIEALGSFDWIDAGLIEMAVQAGRILGREGDVLAPMVARFLAPDPPRVSRAGGYVVVTLAPLCAAWSDRASARACVARLRILLDRGTFSGDTAINDRVLAGAERFAADDWSGAARELRVVTSPRGAVRLGVEAAMLAGDDDVDARLALLIDDENAPLSYLHLLAARRAAERGERDRARALARRIVDVWGAADEEVPAVAEMRAMLAQP